MQKKHHDRSIITKNIQLEKKIENVQYLKNTGDFLLNTLAKEFYTTKSPHILITKTFRHIEENSIILHHPVVRNDNSRSRKISYTIMYVGKDIKLNMKKKVYKYLFWKHQ